MKLLRLHSALALTMAGALAFGCSGGSSDDDTTTVIRDSGVTNPGRDGGVRDGGPGGAVCGDGVCDATERFVTCPADCPPPDPCENLTEGCECNSTFTPGDTSFGKDDCMDADNLCIPWDILSGRGMEVILPAQSCVKTCAQDSDCGMTEDGDPRHCVNMDFDGSSAPVGSICVDRLAGIDEFCGGSKNEGILVSNQGAVVKTGFEQVGCAGDAQCLFNASGLLNPDEGVCVQLCGRAGDPGCPTDFPYCNPDLIEVGTSTAGVCSLGRIGFGSWCNFSEDPDKAGFTSICDQGGPAAIGCLDLTVIGIPAGVCIENCNQGGTNPDDPCDSTDANNRVVCQVLDAATGDGVCINEDVEFFPDTCGGDGAYGNGRLGFGVVFGDMRIPANWCVDRLDPILAPGTITTAPQITAGDNCAANPLDEYRCPDPTICIGDGSGSNGTCLVGCILGDATAGDMYCEDSLTTLGLPTTNSVCKDMILTSTIVGLCAGD